MFNPRKWNSENWITAFCSFMLLFFFMKDVVFASTDFPKETITRNFRIVKKLIVVAAWHNNRLEKASIDPIPFRKDIIGHCGERVIVLSHEAWTSAKEHALVLEYRRTPNDFGLYEIVDLEQFREMLQGSK
jgi:hypothetical protein